jgi:hypothetical protein
VMKELGVIYIRSAALPARRINAVAGLDKPAKTELNTSAGGTSTLSYSVGSGRIRVRSQAGSSHIDSPFCLAVKDNASANGTPIILRNCDSSGAQVFRMTAAAQLLVPSLGKCVRENGSNRLVLATCSTEARQRWIVDADPGI